MTDKKENRILFGPGGCITRETIERYIDGVLSDSENKQVRRHAKNCEICADALEGAGFFNSGAHFSNSLTRLDHSPWRQKLNPRVGNRRLFVGISSVAASVALLMGIYFIFQVKNSIDKEGGFYSGQDVAAVEELNKDSLPVDKNSFKEAMSESNTIDPKDKRSDTKNITEKPQTPPSEVLVIEEDEIDFELAEEIEYEEEPDKVSLEKIVIAEEKNESKVSASAEQPVISMAKAVDYKSEEILNEVESTSKKRSVFKSREKEDREDSYYVAEVMPMFQGGGIDKFNKYLADSLKVILPDSVINQSIIVGFRVDTAGNVDNVRLINGTDSRELNKEIIRLVKQSPMWIPAELNGQAIAVDQQLEVVFNGK